MTNKKLNYFSAILFLSKYIKKHKRNFIMFYFGWFFDMVLSVALPIMFGVMIDEIVYRQNVDTFIRISIVFVTMSVFYCVLYFFIYAQHHYLMCMYTLDIKKDIFNHIQKCDAEFMTDAASGDIIANLQWYSNECMHFVIRNIIHFVNGIINIIAVVIYIFIINSQIGLFILIAAPVSVFINTKFGTKIRKYGDKQKEYYSEYISWVFEILSSLRDIRMLGAQKKTNLMFKESHKKLFDINIKSSISILTANNLINFINLCVQLAIFTFAGYSALSGNISIGVLTVVVAFYGMLTSRISGTSNSYLDAQSRVSYIQRIYDFLNSPTEDAHTGKDELYITNGNISFCNINFAYKKSVSIFDGLNLDIEAGKSFALIGESGCGKTTIAYMLIGFFQPQRGEIIIDGQKLSDCSLKSIRRNIGLIAQDVLIFDGTIRENIFLGNRKATENDIIFSCVQSGLWDFIQTLPQMLDTVIGKQGINLSGGQKQRIAIARIYLKNPKIIIFDEATSSLDNETEESIHKAWKEVLSGRTSIIIAHRQSSVMMCQNAAIIKDGKICEIGTPCDMAKNSSSFKTLFAIKE